MDSATTLLDRLISDSWARDVEIVEPCSECLRYACRCESESGQPSRPVG